MQEHPEGHLVHDQVVPSGDRFVVLEHGEKDGDEIDMGLRQ